MSLLRGAAHNAAIKWVDFRGFSKVRADVCGPATGTVLDLGGGTGVNLQYLTGASSISVVEPDVALHRWIERRAHGVAVPVAAHVATGEAIPFTSGSFDTVVMTLVLCSVSDPGLVAAEIRRVLRPGGQLRFAEHVRAPDPSKAAIQDRWAGAWTRCSGGCHPNRDTLATLERAGFTIQDLRRGKMPGSPSIVRPLAVGVAVPSG